MTTKMKTSLYLAANLMAVLLFATQLVRYAQGLNCFQCTGDASPLCDEKHTGESVTCISDYDYYDACWIMRVFTIATKRYEIYKGCNINFPSVKDSKENWVSLYNNCSSKVGDDPVKTFWQEITYCYCEDDDCNEVTIHGVGREDIEQREAAEAASDGNILKIRYITMLAINMMLGYAVNVELCI